jgi:hypothetical protein
MKPPYTEYIGDSVYMEFDGYSFLIFTDNGMGRENVIWLEPEVVNKMFAYTNRVKEIIKATE